MRNLRPLDAPPSFSRPFRHARALTFVAAMVLSAPASAEPHVVVGVGSGDPIGGLAIKREPDIRAVRVGVIPSAGTGVDVSECLVNRWCRVSFRGVEGWSYGAYLAPESERYADVVGVSPADPEGLIVRSGPGGQFPKMWSLAFNAQRLIRHACEATPTGSWCLIS